MAHSLEIDHEPHPLEEDNGALEPEVIICVGTIPPVLLAIEPSRGLVQGSVLPEDADPHTSTAVGIQVDIDLALDELTAKRYEKGQITVEDVLRYAAQMILIAQEASDS